GPDVGVQYRSVIFCHDEQQEKTAKESKERLAKSSRFKRPIVTQIEQAKEFFKAEEYHQQYYEKCGISSHQIIPTPNFCTKSSQQCQ
ncbi:MAG: peptide-methionine (S)-S-oxide reductase, partial [Candidatus Nitrosotenuis sp.]